MSPIEHPRDAEGRVLPRPGWPPARSAPGELEFLRRFCNTVNRENGADRLADAGVLDDWLRSEGREPVEASDRDLRRLTAFREELFGLLAAEHAVMPNAHDRGASVDRLARSLAHLRLRFGTETGELRLSSSTTAPVDNLVARLALILVDAMRTGSWRRLTPCAHCRWVIYDGSKNRSARWCSMSACGGRHNARTYRSRRRPTDP